jgi:cytochrome oxidase Cu insertion factor (SCO1/SenC/PrrC family)
VTRRAGLLVSVVALGVLFSACSSSGRSNSGGAPGQAPKVGQPAPDFTLPSATGPALSLAKFRGETPVLLYFSMGPG